MKLLDHQHGYDHNSSDILHLLNTGEKTEYSGTVHQLFIDIKKTCYVRDKILHNIFIESGVIMELIRIIKMC
jgi:hypothetical protein